MDWKAENDQRQNAMMRILLMFIGMALIVVRAGLDARGAVFVAPATPQDDPTIWVNPDAPPSAHLLPSATQLLAAARAILSQIESLDREIYEFMKLASILVLSLRSESCCLADPPDQQFQPFDTS